MARSTKQGKKSAVVLTSRRNTKTGKPECWLAVEHGVRFRNDAEGYGVVGHKLTKAECISIATALLNQAARS